MSRNIPITTTAVEQFCAKCGRRLGYASTIHGGQHFHPECDQVLSAMPTERKPLQAKHVKDLKEMLAAPALADSQLMSELRKLKKILLELITKEPVDD